MWLKSRDIDVGKWYLFNYDVLTQNLQVSAFNLV